MLPDHQSHASQINQTEESVAILNQGCFPVWIAFDVGNEAWYEGEEMEHQEDGPGDGLVPALSQAYSCNFYISMRSHRVCIYLL